MPGISASLATADRTAWSGASGPVARRRYGVHVSAPVDAPATAAPRPAGWRYLTHNGHRGSSVRTVSLLPPGLSVPGRTRQGRLGVSSYRERDTSGCRDDPA